MNLDDFRKYLKRMGKKDHVVDELIQEVTRFDEYLAGHGKSIEQAYEADIQTYADVLEERHPGKGRKMVRGLVLFFHFSGKDSLARIAHAIREQETAHTRNAFRLRDFRGVNPNEIARLQAGGIVNTEQMLEAGKSPQSRVELAAQTGVNLDSILELVKLSDLSRLDGLKGVRTRLYYDAGVDTLEKLALWNPDELVQFLREFVERTHFDGIAPLPKEVRNGVESARKLEQLVDFDQ